MQSKMKNYYGDIIKIAIKNIDDKLNNSYLNVKN